MKEIFRKIKWFFQRGRRGFADVDVWNMDWYLEHLILNMLKQLRETKHGYPSCFETSEEWDEEFDKMIYYFEEAFEDTCSKQNKYEEEYMEELSKANSYIDENNIYHLDLSEKGEKLSRQRLSEEYRLEEYREENKNKAFEMFSKYFHCLWD